MKVLLALILIPILSHANCTYELDSENSQFSWTGYKFTSKDPVSGSFNNIKYKSLKAKSLEELIKSTTVTIDTESFESKNPARNKNIINHLFNKVVSGEKIAGVVKSVDSKAKTADVQISWGESKSIVDFNYTEKDGMLELSQTIDILKIGHDKAYESLKKACKVHHRGKDGKVKSYSEVLIKISAKIKKSCTS